MFFANALKDYVDQLNDLALLLTDNFTFFTFCKSLLFYFFDSFKLVFIYIFSCKWLTDFIELPCSFKSNYIAILEGQNLFESNVNPSFFEFLETKTLTSNLFLTGILNSFFLSLPFSVPHLLTLRAFLINGLPAGVATATGTIVGQLSFFLCVFFGFESVLLPFLSFEPFNYILGFVILVNVLYSMVHKPNMDVIKMFESNLLLKFFSLNFLLAWTEQTSLFQYFGNLTVSNLPTLLQGADNSVVQINKISDFYLPNSLYLIGLLIGSFLWTGLFGLIITFMRDFLSQITRTPFLFINERIHKFLCVLTLTLCLTSIPYYGFDYLVSAPLGFISQDKALNFFKAKTNYLTLSQDQSGILNESFINPIPFDRTLQIEPKSKESYLSTFEDNSIDAENSWKNREVLRPVQSERSSKTSRRSNTSQSEEVVQQEEKYIKDFYKINPLTFVSTKNFTKVEKDIDKIANNLFNPIAYQYYQANINEVPYTRKLFREKFYKNPVYQAFVNLDMIGFLKGQPEFYNLTAKDEADLYKRRSILENYLHSICDYKDLVLKEQKKNSYAEKVYNQQFKGSLDLVRHYFAISLTNPVERLRSGRFSPKNETVEVKKVLKFDQPLYNSSLKKLNLLHEELNPNLKTKSVVTMNSLEIQKPDSLKIDNQKDISAILKIEETDAIPFYIGWDTTLRKFLVKQACTPGIPYGNQAFLNNSSLLSEPVIQDYNNQTQLPTYFSFQSWPLNSIENTSKAVLGKNLSIPYNVLSKDEALKVAQLLGLKTVEFEKANLSKSHLLETENLPFYNWTRFLVTEEKARVAKELGDFIDLGNTPPPQLGGLSWPGINKNLRQLINFIPNSK
uniref:Hypothetical chloroplast RF1 n=1 Tax=Hazenia capsulata TaxID=2202518 RepID=A0A1W6EHK0_9CHLO|nr:hypothetical chloroplast RF1 [Hazenia capsulata]ARK14887.1 hypothetical chloroplast RF1 [Hazenia capsulata]